MDYFGYLLIFCFMYHNKGVVEAVRCSCLHALNLDADLINILTKGNYWTKKYINSGQELTFPFSQSAPADGIKGHTLSRTTYDFENAHQTLVTHTYKLYNQDLVSYFKHTFNVEYNAAIFEAESVAYTGKINEGLITDIEQFISSNFKFYLVGNIDDGAVLIFKMCDRNAAWVQIEDGILKKLEKQERKPLEEYAESIAAILRRIGMADGVTITDIAENEFPIETNFIITLM